MFPRTASSTSYGPGRTSGPARWLPVSAVSMTTPSPVLPAIRRMSPQQRAKVEAELKDMPAADAPELVKTLAHDPDAGSTGDVAYIEEADQDDRDDDE